MNTYILWKQGKHGRNENSRLRLTSLFITSNVQHQPRPLAPAYEELLLSNKQNKLSDPKGSENTNNLHNDDIPGDVTRHNTSSCSEYERHGTQQRNENNRLGLPGKAQESLV